MQVSRIHDPKPPNFPLIIIICGLLMVFAQRLVGQEMGTITGRVVDEEGRPLQYVNVFLLAGIEGAMTDQDGRFEIKTSQIGPGTLRITYIGYGEEDVEVVVSSTQLVEVNIALEPALIEFDRVTVSASSFTMADKEGQTLNSMDVVTTAGASADIFRAIQTLPGVTQVDEGAGMFVRGGDVSETIVLLDQATVSHPYKYASDTGGYFGMISPFLLSGTYFASGAFSAKYGNALSGVLAMESLGMPDLRTINLGLGLAAISVGLNQPIVPGKLGLRLSGNYSDTGPMFKLNEALSDVKGITDRFEQMPTSWDTNLSLIYKYSRRGQVKLFNYLSQDDIGVLYESPSYVGTFISGTQSALTNLQWRHLVGERLLLTSSLSGNAFNQALGAGNLSLDINDRFAKWRTDFVLYATDKVVLNGGFEIDRSKTQLSGSVPEDENDLSPGAAVTTFATDYSSDHGGFYIESELDISPRLFAIGGLRLDYLTGSQDRTIDPRLSLGYRLGRFQILKLATGRYHQYPQTQFRDSEYGNPELRPLSAIHYVAGYEIKTELTNFKLELYYKDYANLPLEDSLLNFTSDGSGRAYGADVFLKGALPLVSGWVSYSYLSSEKKELNHLRMVPTDYDIRHQFTAALKSQLGAKNAVSLTYRYTSGRPYTATPNEWNAQRLPPSQRLDLSFSHFFVFGGDDFIVFYAAVSNLLDRRNIYGYLYSPDYSERIELKSTFGRSFYFGFSSSIQ